MSGIEWRPGDAGSAYGHRQHVADSGTFARIRAAQAALTEHLDQCEECGIGDDALCEAGRQLTEEHLKLNAPSAVPGYAVGIRTARVPIRRRDTRGDTP